MLKFVVCLAVALAFGGVCEAKMMSKCEFVKIARQHFPANELDDWTCIAQHESTFNTKATNKNTNGSTDYGIFQINDKWWCTPGKYNGCKMSCASLMEDNILNAIKCAKIVKQQQGFSAWVAWKNKCANGKAVGYSKGC